MRTERPAPDRNACRAAALPLMERARSDVDRSADELGYPRDISVGQHGLLVPTARRLPWRLRCGGISCGR